MRRSLAVLGCTGLFACSSQALPPLSNAESRADAHRSVEIPSDRVIVRLSEVAWHGERVWLRGVDGTLSAVDPERPKTATRHLVDEYVVDIHRTPDGQLWVLSHTFESDDLRVWGRRAAGWEPIFEMAAPRDKALALTDIEGKPLVLTERSVHWVDGTKLSSVSLDEPIRIGLVRQVQLAATSVGTAFVGTNSGEFGGKLTRIVLATGKTRVLRREDEGVICKRPLDPECDPITGIVTDPDDSRCVLSSVGLRHFMESGRLLRVCGLSVRVVHGPWEHVPTIDDDPTALLESLDAPAPEASVEGPQDGSTMSICAIDPAACPAVLPEEPQGEWGIFGLARSRTGTWIVTTAGLYHLAAGRTLSFTEFSYRPLGRSGFGRVPGAIAVATDVNWYASVSGYTPLVSATNQLPSATTSYSPRGECWHTKGTTLCLDSDRYFIDRGGGTNSAKVTWKPAKSGWLAGELPWGETLEVSRRSDHLLVAVRYQDRRVLTKLARMSQADETRRRAQIATLPRVEAACAQVAPCARAVYDAREHPEYSNEVPAPSQERRDLTTCTRVIGDLLRRIEVPPPSVTRACSIHADE